VGQPAGHTTGRRLTHAMACDSPRSGVGVESR